MSITLYRKPSQHTHYYHYSYSYRVKVVNVVLGLSATTMGVNSGETVSVVKPIKEVCVSAWFCGECMADHI